MSRHSKISLLQIAQVVGLFLVAILFLVYFGSDKKKKTVPLSKKKQITQQNLPKKFLSGIPDLHKAKVKITRHDRKRMQSGITLIPVAGTEQILLLDEDGNIKHEWDGLDAARVRLLSDCSILVIHGSKWGLKFDAWRERKKTLSIYDWNGEEIRNYQGEDSIHHDARLLSNNNLFFLEARLIPYPEDYPDPPTEEESYIRADAVYEVTPENEKVYTWFAENHLDMLNCGWNGCEVKQKVKEERAHIWDWTHLNTLAPLPENKHFEAGDERFRPDNFFILPRNFWNAYLVDRKTKEIVWEYSGSGKEKDVHKRLVRGHEIHMIPQGYPGAGNVLIFDNGMDHVRAYSRVLEIDPVTKQTVWEYVDKKRFYSRGGGSIQRLQNGNTLISQDKRGRIFEVTPKKGIVWEAHVGHRISRAHKYSRSYCPMLSDDFDAHRE